MENFVTRKGEEGLGNVARTTNKKKLNCKILKTGSNLDF